MDIIEQRKAILDDNDKKSFDELKEFLKKSGFDLNRGYATIRGQSSTVFIQDVNAHRNKKNPTLQEGELMATGAFETLRECGGANALEAAITLLQQKIKNEGMESLTPIEVCLMQMMVIGKKVIDEFEKQKSGEQNKENEL